MEFFKQQFGDVTVHNSVTKIRGVCLRAVRPDGTCILMDGYRSAARAVPDGNSAYFFGSKIILTVRRSDTAEVVAAENGELTLVLYPLDHVQFGLRAGGSWGAVSTELYPCCRALNGEAMAVEELIFLFTDTRNPDHITARSAKLPRSLQTMLQKYAAQLYKITALDERIPELEKAAAEDFSRDYWDLLYEENRKLSAEDTLRAAKEDPADVCDGIYITVDKNNRVIECRRNAAPQPDKISVPAEKKEPAKKNEPPKYSEEVKSDILAAKKGDPEAYYRLGQRFELGDGVPRDETRAAVSYQSAADAGFNRARYALGVLYQEGRGVTQSTEKAAKLFGEAAAGGDRDAQFSLSLCYYRGEGVPQDSRRALEWLRKAAEQGHPQAKQALGMQ